MSTTNELQLPVITSSPHVPKTINGRRALKSEVPAGECLCDYCNAKCCRYFALPIDVPTTHQDFDYMRWYLLHDKATVFVDDSAWYLLVHTVCKHLQPNNLCGIYHTRPQICRDYSTDACEYDDDAVYDMYFETPEQVSEYVEARLGNPKSKSIRSPEPELLPVLS